MSLQPTDLRPYQRLYALDGSGLATVMKREEVNDPNEIERADWQSRGTGRRWWIASNRSQKLYTTEEAVAAFALDRRRYHLITRSAGE